MWRQGFRAAVLYTVYIYFAQPMAIVWYTLFVQKCEKRSALKIALSTSIVEIPFDAANVTDITFDYTE